MKKSSFSYICLLLLLILGSGLTQHNPHRNLSEHNDGEIPHFEDGKTSDGEAYNLKTATLLLWKKANILIHITSNYHYLPYIHPVLKSAFYDAHFIKGVTHKLLDKIADGEDDHADHLDRHTCIKILKFKIYRLAAYLYKLKSVKAKLEYSLDNLEYIDGEIRAHSDGEVYDYYTYQKLKLIKFLTTVISHVHHKVCKSIEFLQETIEILHEKLHAKLKDGEDGEKTDGETPSIPTPPPVVTTGDGETIDGEDGEKDKDGEDGESVKICLLKIWKKLSIIIYKAHYKNLNYIYGLSKYTLKDSAKLEHKSAHIKDFILHHDDSADHLDGEECIDLLRYKIHRLSAYLYKIQSIKKKLAKIAHILSYLKEHLEKRIADGEHTYFAAHFEYRIKQIEHIQAKIDLIYYKIDSSRNNFKDALHHLYKKLHEKLKDGETDGETPSIPTPPPVVTTGDGETLDGEDGEKIKDGEDGESVKINLLKIWKKLSIIIYKLHPKAFNYIYGLSKYTLKDSIKLEHQSKHIRDFILYHDDIADHLDGEECIQLLRYKIHRLSAYLYKIHSIKKKLQIIATKLHQFKAILEAKLADGENSYYAHHFEYRIQQITHILAKIDLIYYKIDASRDNFKEALYHLYQKLHEKLKDGETPVDGETPSIPTPPPVVTTGDGETIDGEDGEDDDKLDGENKSVGICLLRLWKKLSYIIEKAPEYESIYAVHYVTKSAVHDAAKLDHKIAKILDYIMNNDHEAQDHYELIRQIKSLKLAIYRFKAYLLKVKSIKIKIFKIHHILLNIAKHLIYKIHQIDGEDHYDGELKYHLLHRLKSIYHIKYLIRIIQYKTYRVESNLETIIFKLLAKLRGKFEDGEISTDYYPHPHYPLVDGEDGEELNDCFKQIWESFKDLFDGIKESDDIKSHYYQINKLLGKAYDFRLIIQRIIKNLTKRLPHDHSHDGEYDHYRCIYLIKAKLYKLKVLATKIKVIQQKCLEISEIIYGKIEAVKYYLYKLKQDGESDGEAHYHLLHKLIKLRHIAFRLAIFKTHNLRTHRLIARVIHKYHLILWKKIDKPDGETVIPTPTPPTPPPVVTTPPLNVQECHDNLGELMDAEGNTLMTNSCEPFVADNETKFKFTVSFLAPYEFNEECLDLEVIFESTTLVEGDAACDQWSFNPDTQEIVWNIKLSDFVDVYGCEWIAEDDQFTWVCDFKVNILFMDMVQQCYNAKLQVTLDRIYDGELTVNVVKNEVQGECCENELNVETELRFCTSIECNAFLPSPLTVIRKDIFYVEHRIVTSGFSNFYLSLISVELGGFLPVIEDTVIEKGRLILALRSNIAKPDLVLTVISRLEKTTPGRRLRVLQQSIREDYDVKGVEQMTILNPKDADKLVSQGGQKLTQEGTGNVDGQKVTSEEQDLMTIAVILGSVLLSLVLVMGVFCYVRKQKKQMKDSSPPSLDDNVVVTESNE